MGIPALRLFKFPAFDYNCSIDKRSYRDAASKKQKNIEHCCRALPTAGYSFTTQAQVSVENAIYSDPICHSSLGVDMSNGEKSAYLTNQPMIDK